MGCIIDVIGKILERRLCFSLAYLQMYWDDIELEAEKNRLLLMEGGSVSKKLDENVQDIAAGKKKNKKTKDREKELKRLERERDQLRLQRNEEAQKELQQEGEDQDDDDRYPIPQEVDDNNEDSDISDDSTEEELGEIEEDFSGTFYDIQRQQNSADKKRGGKFESPKHTNEKQKKKNSNDSEKERLKAEKNRLEAEKKKAIEAEREKNRLEAEKKKVIEAEREK